MSARPLISAAELVTLFVEYEALLGAEGLVEVVYAPCALDLARFMAERLNEKRG